MKYQKSACNKLYPIETILCRTCESVKGNAKERLRSDFDRTVNCGLDEISPTVSSNSLSQVPQPSSSLPPSPCSIDASQTPSGCSKPDRIPPKTFFAYARASNLAHNPTVNTGLADLSIIHTCRQKPLEPYIKWLLASCNLIRKLGYQKCLECIFRITTNKRSNQVSRKSTRDDTRKEVRIQKRLNHTEMIYQSREFCDNRTVSK